MRIAYSKAALQVLRRMPANDAKRIRTKIEAYAADPSSQENNVIKLQGRDGYRMRIGDWCIIFDQDGMVLAILAIGPRGRIYER